MASPLALPLLRELVRSRASSVRAAAVRALGALPDAEAAAIVDELVQDPSEDVRIAFLDVATWTGDALLRTAPLRRDPAIVVRSRLVGFNRQLEEASKDLGASEWQTFWNVIVPFMMPGLVAGALLAFTLSLDDFVITYFTSGPETVTFPVKVYSLVRRGVSPEINAASTVLIVITVVATAVVLVAMSFVGVEALLRTSEPGVPAAPPEVPSNAAALRATVTWDGESCTYEGPRTLLAPDQMLAPSERQRLRITLENRSSPGSVTVVVGKLQRGSSYTEFVEWAATHEVNFYGTFPPRRFLVPGAGQVFNGRILRAGFGRLFPAVGPGRYWVVCMTYPPDEMGGTLHPAALLQVTAGS